MDMDAAAYNIGKAVIDRDALLRQYDHVKGIESVILSASLVYSLIDAIRQNRAVVSRLSSEQVQLMELARTTPQSGGPDPHTLLSFAWFLQAWDDADAIGSTGLSRELARFDKLPADLRSRLVELLGYRPSRTFTYKKYTLVKGLLEDATRKLATDIGRLTMDIREIV
jgi:hypothetical protein